MISFETVQFWPNSVRPLTAYLKIDNWDDYHFKTLFELLLVDAKGEQHELGPVKIMSEGMEPGRVQIPGSFNLLPDQYCSLGQSQDYYEKVFQLPEQLKHELLLAMRDCVANADLWERFRNEKAMTVSLLRGIDAFSVTNTYRTVLEGKVVLTPYRFRFSGPTINQAGQQLDIEFNVEPQSAPPSNLHVVIGRNGVGKTRLLGSISRAITSSSLFSQEGEHGRITFLPSFGPMAHRPGKFSNLVAIAFSAFDRFIPLDSKQIVGDIQYTYVGLRKPSNDGSPGDLKSHREINNEFAHSLALSLAGPRHQRWLALIGTLNSDPGFAELELQDLNATNQDQLTLAVTRFDQLSSGHRLVLLTVAKLVELVDERTLVLIDEPESHLHPPLLSSLMRALSALLTMRNGVAIVATHSPVVLQEVPRSCVTIIRRDGEEVSAVRPDIETFAENVGRLTSAVFQLEVTDSGYHTLLKAAAANRTYEAALALFNGNIGSEGRAILRALTAATSGKEN